MKTTEKETKIGGEGRREAGKGACATLAHSTFYCTNEGKEGGDCRLTSLDYKESKDSTAFAGASWRQK